MNRQRPFRIEQVEHKASRGHVISVYFDNLVHYGPREAAIYPGFLRGLESYVSLYCERSLVYVLMLEMASIISVRRYEIVPCPFWPW